MKLKLLPILLLTLLVLAACGGAAAVEPEATLVQVTPLPTDTAVAPTAPPPTDPPPTEPPPTPAPLPEPTPTTDPTPTPRPPAPWVDVTGSILGGPSRWTNKVELADINGDGLVDVLFANGGNYDQPGRLVVSQVFLNSGSNEPYEEVSEDVLGPEGMVARVIKVRDVNNDAIPDIMVGTTFETQSRLYLGEGGGRFTEVTATHLPQIEASVGDLEFGDVDNDGDLDMVLADWGAGSPMANLGGRTMLWRNDGIGVFTDVTTQQMPEALVMFSWELEFVDVDNDYDLDILVSCKRCTGSFLFENDGTGVFTNVSVGRLPQSPNNYEFETMDLDGDTYMDLVTVNDGPVTQERVLINDGEGEFTDATADLWPNQHNPLGIDDNMVAFLDFESDGDADFLIGSLSGHDRIVINDGTGRLELLRTDQMLPLVTGGTLGIAVGDLNGDHRMDIVDAQGEAAFDNKVYFGEAIEPDTAPPVITLVSVEEISDGRAVVRARIHDNKSPTMPHDWQSVLVRYTAAGGQSEELPMQWYGEYLWRAAIEGSGSDLTVEVCAIDAAGNEACVPGP